MNAQALENVTLVAGAARSGTTWLGELINYDHRYRVIFEPLHGKKGWQHPDVKKIPSTYCRPDATDDRLREILMTAFSGGVSSEFVDMYAKDAPADASQILVKEVRVNFMLAWIRAQFPQMPLVVIIRHPTATVKSQIERNWGESIQILTPLLANQNLAETYLTPIHSSLMSLQTDFERRLALWAISHFLMLHEMKQANVCWVFYSALLVDPLTELERIFTYLKQPIDLQQAAARTGIASRMALKNKNVNFRERLDNWAKEFTREEFAMTDRMMKAFGLQSIHSAKDPMSRTDAFYALLNDPKGPQLDPDALKPSRWGWLRR